MAHQPRDQALYPLHLKGCPKPDPEASAPSASSFPPSSKCGKSSRSRDAHYIGDGDGNGCGDDTNA